MLKCCVVIRMRSDPRCFGLRLARLHELCTNTVTCVRRYRKHPKIPASFALKHSAKHSNVHPPAVPVAVLWCRTDTSVSPGWSHPTYEGKISGPEPQLRGWNCGGRRGKSIIRGTPLDHNSSAIMVTFAFGGVLTK